jgi:hypothetical protein
MTLMTPLTCNEALPTGIDVRHRNIPPVALRLYRPPARMPGDSLNPFRSVPIRTSSMTLAMRSFIAITQRTRVKSHLVSTPAKKVL